MTASDDGTRFVVLAGRRTGSTWVISSLNDHPGVACFGELFYAGQSTDVPPHGHRDQVNFAAFLRRVAPGANPVARGRCWSRYLDEVYAPREGAAAVGFKLLYPQARRHPWLLPMLAARRVVAVHLIRDNPLDIIVSQDMAIARGSYHAGEGDAVEKLRISLDPATLERRVRNEERKVRGGRRALRALMLPTIEVRYDDLVEDAGREFGRIFDRFGLPPAPQALASEVRRLNAAPHHETISNYDEVARILRAGGRARLLERRG